MSQDHGDTHLCPDCDEIVEGYQFHSGCCPHAEVEEDDGRDGVRGRLRYFCWDCGAEVRGEPNEYSGIDWVVM